MRTISKRHSPVADESNSKNFLRWKLCLNLFSVTKDSLQVEFKKKIWEGVFIFGFICVPFVNTTPAQEVHNHEHKQEFNPKYTIDVTYEAYIETDQKWRQKGYHPKSISTALARQGQTRYTGLWNFDATISESISSLRLPENEFTITVGQTKYHEKFGEKIDGADIEITARRLAWGKGLNAGQTCIAPDHLLVKESLSISLNREQVLKT